MKFKQFIKEAEKSYDSFVTSKDEEINITGTHKLGTVQTSYDHLVEVFGEPVKFKGDEGDGVRVEWDIEFEALGDEDLENQRNMKLFVATIYDWRTLGPIEEITEWTVGGKNYEVLMMVDDALELLNSS